MSDLKTDIEAGLALLLPKPTPSDGARVLLYSTNRQENPARSPRQLISKDGRLQPVGPAAGDYQFEKGGGLRGVLNFGGLTTQRAQSACKARGVQPTADAVFTAIQTDPILAAAFARLLYYTDPFPLPAVGDEAGAWALYLRTWRPGASDRQPVELRAKWRKSYADAMKAYGFA